MLGRSSCSALNRPHLKRAAKALFTQPPLDAIKSLGLTIKSARSLFALLLSLLVSLAASANSDIRTQTESLIDIVNSIRGSGDGSIKSSSATECKVVDETDVVIYIGQGTTGLLKCGQRH